MRNRWAFLVILSAALTLAASGQGRAQNAGGDARFAAAVSDGLETAATDGQALREELDRAATAQAEIEPAEGDAVEVVATRGAQKGDLHWLVKMFLEDGGILPGVNRLALVMAQKVDRPDGSYLVLETWRIHRAIGEICDMSVSYEYLKGKGYPIRWDETNLKKEKYSCAIPIDVP